MQCSTGSTRNRKRLMPGQSFDTTGIQKTSQALLLAESMIVVDSQQQTMFERSANPGFLRPCFSLA